MAAADIVTAARTVPPALAANGPATCHQAAIGWLLKAEGYTHAWQLMTQINGTFVIPRDLSMWARDHVYHVNARLDRAGLTGAHGALKPDVGDLLFTVQGPNVAHSMVVVNKTPGHVYIRGFNNAGTFNYPAIATPAIPGAYDPHDRDVCDINLWDAAGRGFGAGGGHAELRWVRYQNAATFVRQNLRHWSYALLRTPGWRHNGSVGPCPPDCPR